MSPVRISLSFLIFLTVILFVVCAPDRSSLNQNNAKYPIILIPGLGGSQIEAKLNKTSTPHPYLCSRQSDWYTIWISPSELLPIFIDCFKDNFQRVVDMKTGKTSNSPGVETRVSEWGKTDGIESIANSFIAGSTGSLSYFSSLITFLTTKLGYEKNKSIRGAPYDFRLSPYENEDYFVQLKSLVEETYEMNEKQKVILICHSMGCLHSLYFLKHQTQDWKDKYIRLWVPIGAPFGGSVRTLQSISLGGDKNFRLVRKNLRDLTRSFSSVSYLLPNERVFGEKTILSSINKNRTINVNSKKLPLLFEMYNYPEGYLMWKNSKDLIKDYSHPGVEVHCIFGTGLPTPEQLVYKDDSSLKSDPDVINGDGDGTVLSLSSSVCKEWSETKSDSKKKSSLRNFKGVDHIILVKSVEVMKHLLQIITSSDTN